MTGNHHHGDIPDDHHGNLDTMPGEEIEAVMRRQQAEVTELLAKSGEALRSVCQYIYSGTSLTATRVALIHIYNVRIPVNRFSLIIDPLPLLHHNDVVVGINKPDFSNEGVHELWQCLLSKKATLLYS